jgi:glycosyltransferase involved in cell wall biosynthesis
LLGPAAAQQTVCYGDAQALVNKIVSFLADPAKAAAVGEENRRRVEQNFTVLQMVAAYENLWESLVAD